MIPKKFIKEFFETLKSLKKEKKYNNLTTQELHDAISKIKHELTKKYNLSKIPANYEILFSLSKNEMKKYSKFLELLQIKPTRTLSGVAPLAVMTWPFPCPHGKCITCPGGPKSAFGDVPQSYTGKEPATMRAIRNDYDPYLQVFNRLQQYAILNHDFQKVELIVMGGTFLSFPIDYQYDFVTNLYRALNDFSKLFFRGNKFLVQKFKDFFEMNDVELKNMKKVNTIDEEKLKRIKLKLYALKSMNNDSLKIAQKKNENAKVRAVAMCVETRPDWCFEEHINRMLDFGTTRVEIGVQSVFDDVLKAMNRGHGVKEVIKATQLAKDSFLKVTYHMMLGLPGSSYEKDFKAFKILFEDQRFRPDALKIYPTMVVKGTGLYEMWKQGKYKALELDKTIELLIKIKQIIPKYCRIMRIQRDIPSYVAEAGIKVPNLRQLVNEKLNALLDLQERYKNGKINDEMLSEKLKAMNLNGLMNEIKQGLLHSCNCIRCREIGRKLKSFNVKINKIDFDYHYYKASHGKEIFIELKDYDHDALIGFVRLRMPYKPFRPEIKSDTAGIRQLHVYGKALALKAKAKESFQHRGFGKLLMQEAERIAKDEFGVKRLLVISGIGVRQYYRKLGYRKIGVYMGKRLK